MNEISKNLKCIVIRGDIEVWAEESSISQLIALLATGRNRPFVNVNGQFINTTDIVGIFDAATIESRTRRRNGQWRCESGEWHDRGEKCYCKESLENIPSIAKQWLT